MAKDGQACLQAWGLVSLQEERTQTEEVDESEG